MILEGKKILEILEDYEKELFNTNIKLVAQKESPFMDKRDARDRLRTITAAQVVAVREIRDRLGIPEIKA